MAYLLDLDQVTVCYQHSLLFQPISIRLSRGELVCLQGENGVGKTSLLKAVAGLHSQIVGEIQISDKVQVGWLGHQLAIKPYFTGVEQLHAWAALDGFSLSAPLEKLKRVGLQCHAHKRVQHYSAGMQRRLAMAGLLAAEADLWILDEPQTHLDAEGTALLQDLMHSFLAEGGAILMSSHLKLRDELGSQLVTLEAFK